MLRANKIFIFGILSEIIYISLFCLELWRRHLGDPSLVSKNSYFILLICALLSLSFIIYFFASRLDFNNKLFKLGLIFFLIFNFTLFLCPPITSMDAYTYIHTSRVLSVHHANPYIYSYDNFPEDILASQLKNYWSNAATPYAPLFTIISSIVTFIGQKSLLISLYLFKFIFLILNITNCYLVYLITKSEKATILYAWNPLILFEFGTNAHNDILTVFFLLLCLFFALKDKFNLKNYLLSLLFLLCSVLIKFITAFFLPIIFFIAIKQAVGNREKIKIFYSSVLVSALVILIAYFPFWQGLDTFSRVLFHANHVYKDWHFSSPLVLILIVLFGITGFKNYLSIGTISGKFIFLFSYLVIIFNILKNKKINFNNDLLKYFIICLSIFYASFFTWLMPWYFTCLLVLLICGFAIYKNNKYLWANYIITFWGILYYLFLR